MKPVAQGVLIGAVVGAVAGLLLGLLIHAIVSSDSSLLEYEIIAAVLGLIFGAGLGAFYGGALPYPATAVRHVRPRPYLPFCRRPSRIGGHRMRAQNVGLVSGAGRR